MTTLPASVTEPAPNVLDDLRTAARESFEHLACYSSIRCTAHAPDPLLALLPDAGLQPHQRRAVEIITARPFSPTYPNTAAESAYARASLRRWAARNA